MVLVRIFDLQKEVKVMSYNVAWYIIAYLICVVQDGKKIADLCFYVVNQGDTHRHSHILMMALGNKINSTVGALQVEANLQEHLSDHLHFRKQHFS